ncbi:50S ribosomal protein L6 [Candidatus Pacearchaeota archaeon]|nr:50S ribosomal protein L6 [Candidatus Pacearchaeota archaeon]
MKKNLQQTIEIPEGVEVSLDEGSVTVKGKQGEINRSFDLGKLNFEKKDNKIIIGNKKSTKREKKMMNTIAQHIRNMIKGVQEKFEYKLKVCFSHFPMTVKQEGKKIIVQNFLGEKVPREMTLPKGAEVKIDKAEITVTSVDKELAGQTAANFEILTKIGGRDKRVFQDGIYIINKAGREM